MSEKLVYLDTERQNINSLLDEMELRGNNQLHSNKNQEIFFKCGDFWISSFPGATLDEGDFINSEFTRYLSIVWERKLNNKT